MPNSSDPTLTQHRQNKDSVAGSGGSTEETRPTPNPGGAPPAPFGPPVAPDEVGTLGSYRLAKQLGKGGMGVVYLATDEQLGRQVALKVMLPEFAADVVAEERFLREARAAAQINHDNVVAVYEADERNGMPYIAMPFLRGCSLDEHLRRNGRPTIRFALGVACDAARGLAAAHEIGLVHRDIKPANLWLDVSGGRVKVLDFGLAKPISSESELTRSGAVVGTPAYMSPEQARGESVDHRTDLFSLGAVLYRLCAGTTPFAGPNVMAVLMALGTKEPAPVRDLNPGVPRALAELIHELLAKDPDARPPSAAAVVRRLGAIFQAYTPPRAAFRPAPVALLDEAADVTVSPETPAPRHDRLFRCGWLWPEAGLLFVCAWLGLLLLLG